MKNVLFTISLVAFLLISTIAQEAKVIQTEIEVKGNCNMCKKRIENAVSIDEVKFAKWNKETKKLKLAFVSTITLDSLQSRIAVAGHDSEKFKAADSVYASLPKCCLYRDNASTH